MNELTLLEGKIVSLCRHGHSPDNRWPAVHARLTDTGLVALNARALPEYFEVFVTPEDHSKIASLRLDNCAEATPHE